MSLIQLTMFAMLMLILAIAGQASKAHLNESSYAKGFHERVGVQWAI